MSALPGISAEQKQSVMLQTGICYYFILITINTLVCSASSFTIYCTFLFVVVYFTCRNQKSRTCSVNGLPHVEK